jgi:hypothetical protein
MRSGGPIPRGVSIAIGRESGAHRERLGTRPVGVASGVLRSLRPFPITCTCAEDDVLARQAGHFREMETGLNGHQENRAIASPNHPSQAFFYDVRLFQRTGVGGFF